MRVLVVEDSPTQSTIMRLRLQKRGIEVFAAATLAQATELIKQNLIEVVLLDLSLPDSTGIETFYKVREVDQTLPIVVFTGLDDQTLALEAVKHGAQDYVIKGVASDESIVRCLQYALERTRVEAALRKSEKRFRAILENSYDAFISMDSYWRITEWNEQAEKTFGWAREEALGRKLSQIVPQHLQKQYRKEVEQFFSDKGSDLLRMNGEIIAVKKTGQEFPCEVVVFRIKEDSNYMFCMFARDITLRKQMNEELENLVAERTQELTRSNEELRQFAKIASHDLQEPLRAVQGFASLLAENTKGKLDADSAEFIGFILDGTERMRQLIQAVLTHSSIHHEEAANFVTSANSVMEEVIANLSASIRESGTSIDVDNLPEVNVEREQLIQLFQNLVSNAIKYRADKTPEIKISAERTVEYWLFSVRDNGIGIDPQYADKIFDMFSRLHKKTEYSGTGMGLAICKKIVSSHGGNIWVESEPGKGSIFLFTLPAVKENKETYSGKTD